MAKVEANIVIDRSMEDVYSYVTDFDNMTEWRGDGLEVQRITDGPLRVGTRVRASGTGRRRRLALEVEVMEVEAVVRFAYKGKGGPLSTFNTFTFESDAGGTKVTHTDEIEVRGILSLFEPLLGRLLRRQLEADLASLKVHLEAPGVGDPIRP